MEHPRHLAYVTDDRGLTVVTIEEHRLGYDAERDRFTLPVWADGELVNVRRYLPGAKPGDRMRNFPG